MKAMILAAGLGTRLRPLTNNRPKALVEVAGKPLLAWVIARLAQHGFTEIIINAHHFSEQIEAFVATYHKAYGFPDVSLTVSVEKELLDTGGGVQKARWFFDDQEPFLVHNVDVLTDLDLHGLMAAHRASEALVTLAVKKRPTSRYLLFDKADRLCGWRSTNPEEIRMARPSMGPVTPFPFTCIYVMSPEVFEHMQTPGPYSIIDFFLSLAKGGHPVNAFQANEARWMDLGRKSHLPKVHDLFDKPYFENLVSSV
jgi:NDP-sugar pyrophosphorylase family protein